MTELLPDGADALADLKRLADGPWRGEPEFLGLLRSLIDKGTPVLEIESVTATGTNSGVVRYKLADELQAFMAARVASATDANGHVVESGGRHDAGAPVVLTLEPSA
jgi:hypothetical protein